MKNMTADESRNIRAGFESSFRNNSAELLRFEANPRGQPCGIGFLFSNRAARTVFEDQIAVAMEVLNDRTPVVEKDQSQSLRYIANQSFFSQIEGGAFGLMVVLPGGSRGDIATTCIAQEAIKAEIAPFCTFGLPTS